MKKPSARAETAIFDPQASLQWDVGVFTWNVVQFFRSQNIKIVAYQAPSILRINHIINKSSLSGHHWISKSCRVFSSMDGQILQELFWMATKLQLTLREGVDKKVYFLHFWLFTYLASVENFDGTFGTHYGNLCSWPSIIGVCSQMLACHDIICTGEMYRTKRSEQSSVCKASKPKRCPTLPSIGLSSDDCDFGNVCFRICK